MSTTLQYVVPPVHDGNGSAYPICSCCCHRVVLVYEGGLCFSCREGAKWLGLDCEKVRQNEMIFLLKKLQENPTEQQESYFREVLARISNT